MEDNFSNNLVFLRKQSGLNQTQLAESVGFTKSQWNNYETGKSYPKFLDFLKISKYFDVSESDLVHKKLKKKTEKVYEQRIARPRVIKEPSQMPKLITVDSQGNENIVFVPVAARAGYLDGYGDEDFIKSLPTYRLPMVNNGTFRMFEVKGNSMTPTLHSGCIVVGEWVEDWCNVKDNQIYILVTDEGIVVKRVLNRLEKYGNLFLKSDNRSEFPSYPAKRDEIKEIWKVNLAMLYNLLDPSSLFDRINDLEADVLNLKHNLDKK